LAFSFLNDNIINLIGINFRIFKNIHIFKKIVKKSDIQNVPQINPNKLPHECGAKFSSKIGYCVALGKNKYNGFCGIHKNLNK
jgi:hypothetical protein